VAGRGLKPPSLAAMIPGRRGDMYRDFGYHGGIFSFGFASGWLEQPYAHHLLGKPQSTATDAFSTPCCGNTCASPRRRVWKGRRALWDRIDVPLYSAGNWSGMIAPSRATPRAGCERHRSARSCASRGHALPPFYSEEGRRDQLRFFDQWLKGEDTGINASRR